MAINFLSNVDLNENEILGAAIQNLGTDPSAGVLGQIYYNTSTDVLKICTVASSTNATWEAVGGGVETITADAPLSDSGTSDVTLSITQADATTDGYLSSTDWSTFNGHTSNVGTVTSVELSIDNSAALAVAGDNPITVNGTIDLEWQGNSTEYVTADGGKVNIPTTDNYGFWTLTDGTNSTDIDSEDSVTFSGTSNEVTVGESGGTVTIGLPNDVTISNNLTVGNAIGAVSLGLSGQATSAATAGADGDSTLTTKGYVDSLTSGQLVYAGGYDASQDPPSGASVLQGYTYVVTTAGSGAGGTYWSTPLDIGDLIIALQDNPTTEANWTEVNKNVTEATLSTIGEGNVNAGEGIDVSYSNGTATVSGEDSSATNKGIVIVEGGTNITASYASGTVTLDADLAGTVTDVSATAPIQSSGGSTPDISIDNATAAAVGAASVAGGTGISVSVANGIFTVTNSDPGSTASNGVRYSLGATSGAVTANGSSGGATSWTINTVTDLGKSDAKDVTCQVITSGGETVYADITRSSGTLTISFNGSITNGAYEAILISI